MDINLEGFKIRPTASNREALEKIDLNTKGFLIVVDSEMRVIGTLTDGDIRRAFLRGKSLTDSIESEYNSNYSCAKLIDSLESVIEKFKKNFEFLPIVDQKNQLVNIITRRQLHSLLLQDIQFDLSFNFLNIDEALEDYNIYPRPWGFYKTTVINDYYQSKVISIYPGASLSLQLHCRREEYWIVVHGNGLVSIGDSTKSVEGGSSLFIPKGCKHRITNTSNSETLIVTEVQIGDYFGEDDIIRFEDIYGRE